MAYLLAAGVIVICGITMMSPMLFTSKRIKSYVGVPREAFLLALSKEGIPENISSAVFEFYKAKARWKGFNPGPEMDINGVFEEGSDDIDDAAIDLLKKLQIQAPSELGNYIVDSVA